MAHNQQAYEGASHVDKVKGTTDSKIKLIALA
jgi:hypothetical protein